jgi:PAS domain S-box-containing protein
VTLSRRLLLILALLLGLGFGVLALGGHYFVRQWVEANLLQSAEKVRNVLMATRRIYHHQFIDSGLPINDKTLGFLPAHALHRISKDLHNWDKSGFTFNNVSDLPRNPFNKADAVEMAAIEYFRQHPQEELRFVPFSNEAGQPYYLYARPIRVEKYCLECHGSKSDAPDTIRLNYDEAFGYQEGDLRGILSIKVPAGTLTTQAQASLLALLGVGIVSLGLLGIGIAWSVGRNLIRPLAVLEKHIQDVASGNLSTRITGLTGEFSQVADAYNRMAENLATERFERLAAESALARNAARLDELRKIIESIAGVRDTSALMALISHTLRNLLGADGAALVLRDGNQCHYVDDDAIGPLWKGRRFPLDSCISGWVIQHAQPVALQDIATDPRIPHEDYRNTFVKSLAMVPIGRTQPIGAIGCYWASNHLTATEELEYQHALADAVAIALGNLRLIEDLTQAKAVAETSANALAAALQEQSAARRAALSLMEDAHAARLHAEDAATHLKQSEERFRALVEQSIAGIYIIQGGYFRYVNPGFTAIFGYDSPEELIDQVPVDALISPEDSHRVAENIRRRVDGEIEDILYSFRGLRRDGISIDVEVHGRVFDYQGKPAVIGLILDITSRKRAEEELRARNEELERFNQAMIGREIDMIELKQRINALSSELGRAAPYDLSFLNSNTD